MATELTVKERAFAQLIIEGTKVAAYRTVYSARGTAATQATNAYKLSRKPKIKAEVARLLRQRECPADDYARIRDMAVAGLTEIFLQEEDPKLRAKVGSVLLAYADAGLKVHPVPSEKERRYDELTQFLNDVVREQRGTVSPQHEQLTREKEQTEASLVVEVESGNVSEGQEIVETPELMIADEGTCVEMPVDAASESSEPRGRPELVPIPGFFPPRFRRA